MKGLFGVAIGLALAVESAAFPWQDNFETGLAGWTTNGTWGLSATTSRSPTHSACDSPGAYYTNHTDAKLSLTAGLDLTGAVRPALRFHYTCSLEPGYDFLSLEVSTNAGSAWTRLGEVSGEQTTWARVQVDLADYLGASDVRLRFRMQTDDSVVMDGVYLDDLYIGDAPERLSGLVVFPSQTHTRLAWAPSADAAFAFYRIYRALGTNPPEEAFVPLTAISNSAMTSWTDHAVAPKSRYVYAVSVLNTNDLESDWETVPAVTLPGMEAPFLDNGEAGGAMWLADPPWALAAEAAAGGTLGWSDSPGTNYGNGINASLTLVAPVSLAGWTRPTLMFQHRYHFLAGDYGYIEVSTNTGSSWTSLATFTAASSSWSRMRYDLSAFAGGASLLLRFRVTSDGAGNADGWMLDDLSLSDAPAMVPAPEVTGLQPSSISLAWPASTYPALSHYVVIRSLSNNPTLNTWPQFVTVTQAFTDTGLGVDSNYYYRVFAVNVWGGYSPDSPTATAARTSIPALPWLEDFESGAGWWWIESGWQVSTGAAYQGSLGLGQGLAGYSNNLNSTAGFRVNLSGAQHPVLRFRDWHRLAVNDYGYVEVSAAGRSTLRMYGVYEARTNWAEQVVDLSYWKGYANVQVLFRLTTDGSGTDEGWKVDDVRVTDEGTFTRGTPFVESFENGLGNWVETNRWAAGVGGYQGSMRGEDTLERITPDTYSMLSLKGDFNLTTVTNPVMVVWVKGSLGTYARLGLQVSGNGGGDWGEPWAVSAGWATTEWQRVQVSLASWKTSNTRVRWQLSSYWGSLADANVLIDKVTVGDAPPGVGVTPPVPALKSVQVNWNASALGSRFQSYRVWRSPDTNPENGNDVVVGVVTQELVTSFVDSNLVIGATYYYWVWVTDTNDIWTISTNYVMATTVPVVLPFGDAFDDLSQWDVTGSWGVDTNLNVLTDSPVGDYANSQDTYAKTAVNLTGAIWPILRFKDSFRLAADDYGFVEVSSDGSNWMRIHGVTGARTNWMEHTLDLSQWKNVANLRVRFHATSNSTGTDDGWLIDDMSITDRGANSLPVPFYDGFELGASNWISDAWIVSTNVPYAGSNLLAYGSAYALPDTYSMLCLGGSLDLSLAVDPKVTFRVRGSLGNYSSLRFQVSPDGGITWGEPWVMSTGWYTNQYTALMFSLSSYRTAHVRFRFLLHSYWGAYAPVGVAIDHFSVGESSPGAPGLHRPAQFANTDSIRPTLVVNNAFDPDFDPLTYRFEVYEDAGLSSLLAQVPAVASGVDRTSWQVDVNLPNSQQYWWRCRASDASNTGPWMATATFFINETNAPPSLVQIAGPPKGATLRTASGILTWYPSTDPDAGDVVAAYHIQIDDDPAFASLEVDAQFDGPTPAPTGAFVTISQPLSSLTGWPNLGMISNYFWRIRARDSRFAWSPWTVGGNWFIYGVPAPNPASLNRNANGSMTLTWDVGTENWYIQWAPALTGGWQTVAGPLMVNSWTFSPGGNQTSGFYRVMGE